MIHSTPVKRTRRLCPAGDELSVGPIYTSTHAPNLQIISEAEGAYEITVSDGLSAPYTSTEKLVAVNTSHDGPWTILFKNTSDKHLVIDMMVISIDDEDGKEADTDPVDPPKVAFTTKLVLYSFGGVSLLGALWRWLGY